MQSKSFRCQILLTTFIIVILARQSALGAIVDFTLFVDSDGPGTWEVRADASIGDNAGLSLVSVPLVNVDFPVTIETPFFEYFDAVFFQVGMRNSEVDNLSPIGSSQDVITPMPAVYGLGQTAGTLTMPSGAAFLNSRNVNYDASLLVASGTYAGGLPAFGSGGSANVFTDDTGLALEAATLNFTVVVPEPSTLLLLVLGAGVVAGVRRRR